MKIEDFKENTQIEGVYLVKTAEIKSSTGGFYLDITLMDSSGEINSKIWDAKEDLLNIFSPKTIIMIKGVVNVWKSKKQLKIREYRIVPEGDKYKISDFLQCSPVSQEEMYKYVYDTISGFENEDLKTITLAIVNEFKKDFLCYPAARSNHHSIIGGLLYHVFRMLKTAKALKTVYPNIKLELLQSGIILHDICKTKEMSLDSLGFVKDYTIEGNMLGHITMGVCIIDKYSEDLKIDKELTMMLKHMVLSHHGHMEFGSPVLPMFIEAELLHMIDNIDASLFEFERSEKTVKPGELSLPIPGLDRRRVYRSIFDCR